jgi:hypothetical protein
MQSLLNSNLLIHHTFDHQNCYQLTGESCVLAFIKWSLKSNIWIVHHVGIIRSILNWLFLLSMDANPCLRKIIFLYARE